MPKITSQYCQSVKTPGGQGKNAARTGLSVLLADALRIRNIHVLGKRSLLSGIKVPPEVEARLDDLRNGALILGNRVRPPEIQQAFSSTEDFEDCLKGSNGFRSLGDVEDIRRSPEGVLYTRDARLGEKLSEFLARRDPSRQILEEFLRPRLEDIALEVAEHGSGEVPQLFEALAFVGKHDLIDALFLSLIELEAFGPALEFLECFHRLKQDPKVRKGWLRFWKGNPGLAVKLLEDSDIQKQILKILLELKDLQIFPPILAAIDTEKADINMLTSLYGKLDDRAPARAKYLREFIDILIARGETDRAVRFVDDRLETATKKRRGVLESLLVKLGKVIEQEDRGFVACQQSRLQNCWFELLKGNAGIFERFREAILYLGAEREFLLERIQCGRLNDLVLACDLTKEQDAVDAIYCYAIGTLLRVVERGGVIGEAGKRVLLEFAEAREEDGALKYSAPKAMQTFEDLVFGKPRDLCERRILATLYSKLSGNYSHAAKKIMDRGLDAEGGGNFERALACYKEAMSFYDEALLANPESAMLRQAASRCLYLISSFYMFPKKPGVARDHQRGRAYLERALALEPNNISALQDLQVLQLELGDYLAAIKTGEKILGMVRYAGRKLEDEILNKILCAVLMNLAMAELTAYTNEDNPGAKGRYKTAAEKHVLEASKLSPNDSPDVYINMAAMYLNFKQYDRALSNLVKAVGRARHDPKYALPIIFTNLQDLLSKPLTRKSLASVLAISSGIRKLASSLSPAELREINSMSFVYCCYSLRFLNVADITKEERRTLELEAANLLEVFVKGRKNNLAYMALLMLAEVRYQLKEYKMALDAVDQVIEAGVDFSIPFDSIEGESSIQRVAINKKVRYLGTAVAKLNEAGRDMEARNLMEKARSFIRQTKKEFGDDAIVLMSIGEFYETIGQKKEALSYYWSIVDKHKTFLPPRAYLLSLLWEESVINKEYKISRTALERKHRLRGEFVREAKRLSSDFKIAAQNPAGLEKQIWEHFVGMMIELYMTTKNVDVLEVCRQCAELLPEKTKTAIITLVEIEGPVPKEIKSLVSG